MNDLKEQTPIPTDTSVAKTILEQLGGNQFLAVTGSRNIVAIDQGLCMKLSRNVINATHLRITLNAMDLYDVEYLRCRAGHESVLQRFEGYYADMLVPNFERTTGLFARL